MVMSLCGCGCFHCILRFVGVWVGFWGVLVGKRGAARVVIAWMASMLGDRMGTDSIQSNLNDFAQRCVPQKETLWFPT